MTMRLSDLYGKTVISSRGGVLGQVKGVVIDLSSSSVSHLLLGKIEELVRSDNLRSDFRKNSVAYSRVSKVSEGIVVKAEEPEAQQAK